MDNHTFFKNESTSEDSSHTKIFVIINCAVNAVLMSISIIGNPLVILAILKTPVLRSPSITLLCSLAVSDLLVKLVAQPLYIAKELKEDIFLFQICYFMTYGCCGVSLCTITVVSLDRLTALHYHMRYVTMVTSTRVVYTFVPIWLAIFIGFSIHIHLWSIYIYIICVSVVIVICLLISSFCYIRIFQIVKRHQIQIHAQQQAVQSSEASTGLYYMKLTNNEREGHLFLEIGYLKYQKVNNLTLHNL